MNGWRNWETWNFYNWLSSDGCLECLVDDFGIDGIEDLLKNDLYDQLETIPMGFVRDAATMAIDAIDFDEIIQSLKEDENEA